MKLAIISDIHDNIPRLKEALSIAKREEVRQCICCGDISSLEIVEILSENFEQVYIALGNMDFTLKNKLGLFPDNTEVSDDILELKLSGLRIAIVHHDYKAKSLARESKYDIVFYGHTHTPWEKKIGKTLILNPGEIAGQFGKASFAIFDTQNMKAELKLLK